jgi:hypothetical protein
MMMKIFSESLNVPSSALFSYPTRFADTWFPPRVLEFKSPEEKIDQRFIEFDVVEGNTGESYFRIIKSPHLSRNSAKIIIKRKLQKISRNLNNRLNQPIPWEGDEYLFDTRHDFFWSDKNVAHLLCNVAPVFLSLKEQGIKAAAIVKKDVPPVARKIYDLLGVPIFPTSKPVAGKILSGETDRENSIFWRFGCFGRYFDKLTFEDYQPNTPERVFISRKGSRRITNEADIDLILKNYGFEKVYFEELSLSDQWSFAKNAKVVVAVHGAAIANLAFNRNHVKLIELFHPGFQTRYYRQCISSIHGEWCGVLGQWPADLIRVVDIQKEQRKFAPSDMLIHPDSLLAALDYMGIQP